MTLTTETFADVMESERNRIHEEREALMRQQSDIEQRIRQLNRDMQAVDAYAAAKAGKLPTASRVAKVRSNGAAPRTQHRGQPQAVVDFVAQNPQGMSRGELLVEMGLKGDKSGEMSVSNALTALIKANTLVRNQEGKYILA